MYAIHAAEVLLRHFADVLVYLCRDIVEGLRVQGCTSVTDFEWQRQLRYDCDPVSEEITIRQVWLWARLCSCMLML